MSNFKRESLWLSSKAVGVGIIGLGKSGWGIHVNAIKDRSDFKVTAVTDPMEERRLEAVEQLGCAAYESPEQLIQHNDAEIIVVATPSHTHAELAIAALSAGKHVLVEKPMATDVGEVDRMIEAANNSGNLLSVYQVRRLDPDFLKVKEIIASGVLGPISLIRMTRHSYNRRRDWQTLRKFGGGTLNNWGSHIIDMGLELIDGQYENFFADMRNIVSGGDAEDHVKVVLRGKETIVDVEISGSVAYPGPHWFIAGKYGTAVGSTSELRLKYYDPADAPELQPADEVSLDRKYSREELPWKEETIKITSEKPQRTMFYDRLYDTLRNDAPLFVTPESVRRQIKLFDEIREATGF